MKTQLLFLALVGVLAAQTTVNTAGTTSVSTAATQSVTNVHPAYYFFWDMNQERPNYGLSLPQFNGTVASGGSASYQENMQYFGAASLEANPNDSNNLWLHCLLNDFPTAYAFNLSNNAVWGYSMGKGYVDTEWMYNGTYVDEALVFQVNCKSINASNIYDANDGMALRTDLIGGGSTPGIDGISWVGITAGAKVRVVFRWNRIASNPSSSRTQIRYLIQNAGAQRKSGFSTSSFSQPKGYVWHHVLPGNDTPNQMEMWLKNFKVGGWWDYDLPVNLWQSFEIAAVTQSDLEGGDHSAFAVWETGGTLTRFTLQPAAQMTMPCTVNLWNDDGTVDPLGYTNPAGALGIRDDLNATASGHFGTTFTNQTTVLTYGFAITPGNLATGTFRQVIFNSEQSINNIILALRLRDTGGQEEFLLRNAAGTESSVINVTAGTKYWITISATRGSTCRLRVYDMDTKTQVGSEVTVSAAATSIGSIRFGSTTGSTSQTAGTYNFIDNFVHDLNHAHYPLLPWES